MHEEMSKITVRKANSGDLTQLLRFEQGVIAAERPYDSTLKEDPITYYDLKQLVLSEEAAVVVAEIEGEVIGSGHATIKQARAYLDHAVYVNLGFMYTVPEHRGKGVNQKIINALKDWAKAKGITEIRLTVYQDNESAIAAYEKAGFKKHIIEMRLS